MVPGDRGQYQNQLPLESDSPRLTITRETGLGQERRVDSGRFEFPLVLLGLAFVISSWRGFLLDQRVGGRVELGRDRLVMTARSAIVLAIGVGGGLATVLLGYVARSASARPGIPATS